MTKTIMSGKGFGSSWRSGRSKREQLNSTPVATVYEDDEEEVVRPEPTEGLATQLLRTLHIGKENVNPEGFKQVKSRKQQDLEEKQVSCCQAVFAFRTTLIICHRQSLMPRTRSLQRRSEISEANGATDVH